VKRLIIIIIVVVVVAAGGFAAWNWGLRADTKAAAPTTTTEKVVKGPIKLAVSTKGKVVANLDVDIKCKASGTVTTLPFDVSDEVKKDELLVGLDPVDENRLVMQSEVEFASSKARLVNAQQNLDISLRTLRTDRMRADSAVKSCEARAKDARAKADRQKLLLEKGLGSQEIWETVETAAIQAATDLEAAKIKLEELKTQETAIEVKRQEVKLAESAVTSDNITLSIAKDRLHDTKVFSPMDGVVAARTVQIGQIIASGVSNVGGGTTILTLSDLSHVYILASVDESDIGKVQVGQPVSLWADAYPNETFRGKVVRIATRGVNLSNVVTFEVKIEVMGEKKKLLKPEMTTVVEITAAEKDEALLAPTDGIIRKGGRDPKYFATVVKANGTNEEREVKVGINDGTRWEVTGGLAEGETLLVRKGAADSKWSGGGQQKGRNPLMMPPGGGGRR
jgi:HlyD family secretion protein